MTGTIIFSLNTEITEVHCFHRFGMIQTIQNYNTKRMLFYNLNVNFSEEDRTTNELFVVFVRRLHLQLYCSYNIFIYYYITRVCNYLFLFNCENWFGWISRSKIPWFSKTRRSLSLHHLHIFNAAVNHGCNICNYIIVSEKLCKINSSISFDMHFFYATQEHLRNMKTLCVNHSF